MKILPEYSIAWFSAREIKSHPSAKGMEPAMIVNFRPIRSTAFPPKTPPNKAPMATKDCNRKKELYKQYGSYRFGPSLNGCVTINPKSHVTRNPKPRVTCPSAQHGSIGFCFDNHAYQVSSACFLFYLIACCQNRTLNIVCGANKK